MRDGFAWLPRPLKQTNVVMNSVFGLLIGMFLSTSLVAIFDHYANYGTLYDALLVDANAAKDVCIFMCRNGGQMSLYFGNIVGHVNLDLRELATALNTMAKMLYAVFTTTDGSLSSARTIVGVGALFGAVMGPLTSRR